MGLLDIFSRKTQAETSMPVPQGTALTTISRLPRTNYDFGSAIGGSNRVANTSIVEAVLGWICRNFPEAPIEVQLPNTNGDYEAVIDHPMSSLIEMPNPFYSGIILSMATVLDWWAAGDAYWLKYRNNTKLPIQLWYTPSWMMEPKGNDKGGPEEWITHYEYRPYSGAKFDLDVSEVVHFRHGLNPDNPRKGRGRFTSLLREIFTDEEAANWTASLLRNMGVPGVVISPSKETIDYSPTPEEVTAAKKYIDQSFTGDNRGKPLAFEGPVTVSQFGFSPDQMNLDKIRHVPEERISGVVGIAAIVAGLGAGLERSTFANFAEAREASYEENIIPTQRMFAADLRLQLLRDFEPDIKRTRVLYNTGGVRILQEDKNKEAERWGQLFARGVAKRSEARLKVGLDADKEDEVYAVSLSTELVGPGAPEQPVPPAATSGGSAGAPGAASRQQRAQAKRRAISAKTSSRNARLVRAQARATQSIARRFGDQLLDQFDSIARAASSAFVALGKSDASDADTIIEQIRGVIVDSLPQIQDSYQVAYNLVGEVTWSNIASFLEVELNWGLDDPDARAIIEAGGTRAGMLDMEQSVRDSVMQAISTGREAGLGPRDIARDIRSRVGSAQRASTIARTETKFAQNVSSISGYRKSEVVTGLQAFDNQSGFDDEDCTARDGTIYSFAEAERITSEEHPNGTLSWAPITGRE